MAEIRQTKIVSIPKGYGPTQREQIGQDVINRIKERTRSGLDVNGSIFSGYSQAYEKTGTVNLTLSGDMLAGLSIISHGSGFLRLGFSSSDANNKAAYIQSPRGRKNQPKREFVGISTKDLKKILDRYPL